jgi:hypothetical protein
LGFFYARYSWWVMPGLALWLGFGLAMLPRVAAIIAAGAITLLMLLPQPLRDYQIGPSGLARIFDELQEKARWGDVVLVDPNCDCMDPMEIDYYSRVYFPDGLPFVSEPADHRRVWYVVNPQLDQNLADEIAATRAAGPGFGPARHYFQLYELPPLRDPVVFDNGMAFYGADFPGHASNVMLHEGETVTVRLWWAAERPIDLDYSASLYLTSRGSETLSQVDGPPGLGSLPETSQWETGRLYVEERQITAPYPGGQGTLRLRLAVYHWANPERVNAPGLSEDRALPIGSISVMAW